MKRLTTALLLLLALGAGPAAAAPAWHGGGLHRAAEQSTGITLDEAASQVRRQTGGRILSAETVVREGRRVHRIKVLTPDRKVVIREISAGNGR
ncbi:MAG TPA: hypothetical protein VGB35_05380 [Gammaproteobacteria bacterium]|jgi:uncharacterized membrane protein YkoI